MSGTNDFPPSKETLAKWARDMKCPGLCDENGMIADCEVDIGVGTMVHTVPCSCYPLRAFLRDERLAAALALWEAVEWIEANRPAIYRERGRWGALHGDTDVIGKTLPEAVSALRARLKEESRGE